MIHDIKGIPFQYVCKIIPELKADGTPKECMSQSRYKYKQNIRLHKYGHGPFCRFKIPNRYNGKMGVYVILVDNDIKYIGECKNLGIRFNMGYGNISPRNCYVGGQPTNCRINNLVLEAYKSGAQIELLFYETKDRFNIERTLIKTLNPEWNKALGKSSDPSGEQTSNPGKGEKKKMVKNKYYRLEEYLRKSQKEVEAMSYEEIEKILGFKLPQSASVYRAWWANDKTHSQAHAWLNASWKVKEVNLRNSVTFEKIKGN